MMRILRFVLVLLILNVTIHSGKCRDDKNLVVEPAMTGDEIKKGLKSHDRALFIKEHWIRDPYIVLGPDNYYYLTGTTPNPNDPREQSDPYNNGLMKTSIVGYHVQLWKSKDLINWEYQGTPYTIDDSHRKQLGLDESVKDWGAAGNKVLWASEIHWVQNKWALVHCPKGLSSMACTNGKEVKGPWTHPMGKSFDKKHDPSLFMDDDGTWYALWANTYIQRINKDFTGFDSKPFFIQPSTKRKKPNTEHDSISVIGHEGATMRKIGGKYISFGTAWSTDTPRKGSYNLYYCQADEIFGEYGPRKFVGRFLGHGTPFQDKQGRWWCTVFYNADVPPIAKEGVQKKDLSGIAQSINKRGTTIVPLEVKVLENGEVYIRAKDPAYTMPGKDENQNFE